MSLAIEKVRPVTVHDPRVVQQERVQPVLKGGQEVLYKAYTTNSISSSSITFHCPPPSQHLYVDRKVHLRLPVTITIPAQAVTGIVADKYMIDADKFAIRSFPLQKAMETIQMTINNQSMSINIGDMLSALEHFNMSNKLRTIDFSKCATYPCSASQVFGALSAGSARSPMAEWEDAAWGEVPKKPSFTVSANPITTEDASSECTLSFVSTEPLFLSPLFWGDCADNDSAFYGVKTMDFTFNFVGSAGNRMIAIDGNGIWANDADARASTLRCEASFNSAVDGESAALLFQYITPQLVDRGSSMQKVLNYPYVSIERYLNNVSVNSIASGSSLGSLSSNNVQLNSVPSKLYIFGRLSKSQLQKNPYSPDCFIQLKNLQLQWGNRSGLLGSASEQQRYDIAVRAGCTLSYADWACLPLNNDTAGADYGKAAQQYRGCGTIQAIDPIDLGLDSLCAPGKLDQITLQVQCDATNYSGITVNDVDFMVVAVSQGIFTLFNGQASSLIGVLNSNDILNSHEQTASELISYADARSMYGGNFLSDLKSSLSHLGKKRKVEAAGSASGGQRVARSALSARLA